MNKKLRTILITIVLTEKTFLSSYAYIVLYLDWKSKRFVKNCFPDKSTYRVYFTLYLPTAHWTSAQLHHIVWVFRLTWQRDIKLPQQPSIIRQVINDPVRLADVYHRCPHRIRRGVSISQYYLADGLCQLTTTIITQRHSLGEMTHGQSIWIIRVNTADPEHWVARYCSSFEYI